jgi:hypothetical protein
MTDTNEISGQRDRSPAFPVVSLETAIGKLTEFEVHFKRTPARPEKVGEAWSIKTKAYVDRISAALRYFGLLEYQGAGKDRSIVVSEEGRKYLRAHQEETKQQVIKAAALRPKQLAKFWDEWGGDRPADAACMDDLIQNHGFSDSGARDFLKVYDATITYAKLSDSDKASVGPVDEIQDEQQETPPMTPHVQPSPKPDTTPPPLSARANLTAQRQAIFPVSDGDVIITFPADLSSEGLEELGQYLDVFLKKQRKERDKKKIELDKEAAN